MPVTTVRILTPDHQEIAMRHETSLPFLKLFCFDLETELMRPGCMAPEIACMTWCDATGAPEIAADRTEIQSRLRIALLDPEVLFVGQNVAYDFGCVAANFPDLVPLVFAAYKAGRVTDTMIRQKILDISHGEYRGYLDDDLVWHKLGYSLFDLVRRHCNGRLLQKDGWRLRYGRMIGVPLRDWPSKAQELQVEARVLLQREAYKPEAERWYDGLDVKDLLAILEDPPEQCIKYPLDDASTTRDVFFAQEPCDPDHVGIQALKMQYFEAQAAFALHLSSCAGIRTDPAKVDAFEQEALEEVEDIKARLQAEGLVRKDGSRDTKKAAACMEAACAREEVPLRRTEKGGICLDAEACAACGDSLMEDYAAFAILQKSISADVPMLRRGEKTGISPRYDVAETLRTTCSGPNLQNIRRSG